ncbi:MAG: hypothetical protein V3W34_11100 [Phycisphaerae bacterium]
MLLATSFFLPTDGCIVYSAIPAEAAADWIKDPGFKKDLVGFAGFILLVAPHLYGLMTLVLALRFVSGNRSGEQLIGRSMAVLLGATAASVIILICWEMRQVYLGVEESLIVVAAVIASLYLLAALARGVVGLLHLRWFGSVCCCLAFWLPCLTTFFLWLTDGGARFGLFVSLGGAVLIGTGAYAEAKIRCGRGWLVTLGQLACCRLKLLPTGEPRCTKCGYLLIGLTTERCPECGQPFRWSDFASLKKDQ